MTKKMNGSIVLSDKRAEAQWKIVHAPMKFWDFGRPMQKILGIVSNPRQLIDTYLMFHQLLGNDVQRFHEAMGSASRN